MVRVVCDAVIWIADALQLPQKAGGRVHGIEVKADLVAQRLLHFLEFVLAQHPVVHEDAGQA